MTKTREENHKLQTQDGFKNKTGKIKKPKLGPLHRTIVKVIHNKRGKKGSSSSSMVKSHQPKTPPPIHGISPQTPTDSTTQIHCNSVVGNSARDATLSSLAQRNSSQIKTTPGCSKISSNNSSGPNGASDGTRVQVLEAGVTVDVKLEYGEYVLRIEKRSTLSSSDEKKREEAKKLAENADKLFLQAEMLRDMGELLLAKYQTSLQLQSTARKLEFDATDH